jgi:acetyl esterase/lipase
MASRMIFPAIFCLLVSLPILLPIPTLLGWKITLVVTEYSQWFVLLTLGIFVLSWRLDSWGASTLLAGCATAIFILPLGSAFKKYQALPKDIRAAFGLSSEEGPPPASFCDLWLGSKPQPVEAEKLSYVQDENGERSLIFYRAKRSSAAPCLLIIHSGGWENGRPEEFPVWNHHWATQGYAVASIQYRLAPQWKWPAQMEDVKEALVFLKSEAGSLGIDPTRFVLMGRSAGGQIATASASILKDPAIRGCVSLYAPADMPFARKYADPNDVLDSLRLLRQYLGGDPEEAGENYLSASATLTAETAFPPTLIVHGERDTLVWHLQSQRLAARLKEKQVPHFYLELPWATHALDFPFHGPSSLLTRFAADVFIRSVFRAR